MAAIALFSSNRAVNSAAVVQDDTLLAAFGSVTGDYAQRELAPGDHAITVQAFFGSATIIVPHDAAVVSETLALFSGVADTTQPTDPATARVRIHVRGLAFCGSIQVKRAPAPAQLPLLEQRDSAAYQGETSRLGVRD